MSSLKQLIKTGEWQSEKHVPVIHVPETINSNELAEIKISIGDAIKHPNTFEHHIVWLKLFYLPEEGQFPIEFISAEFKAHGEGEAFDEPILTTSAKLKNSGTLYALAYCNIHGLWESSKRISVE